MCSRRTCRRDWSAVATAGENGAGPAIDLSWQAELRRPTLAGYVVYRREGDGGVASGFHRQRLSMAPAFHDPQMSSRGTRIAML